MRINRGDRREAVFREDSDRELFLETLAEACAKTDWQVNAYCLMSNHFHLVIETPKANLVAGMKWFLGTYTVRCNLKYRLFGHFEAMASRIGAEHYGLERQESALAKAERIVGEEIRFVGCGGHL